MWLKGKEEEVKVAAQVGEKGGSFSGCRGIIWKSTNSCKSENLYSFPFLYGAKFIFGDTQIVLIKVTCHFFAFFTDIQTKSHGRRRTGWLAATEIQWIKVG